VAEDTRYTIRVRAHDGAITEYEGLEGWRVMEVLRDLGAGIKGECGGALSCATCHVYVDPDWTAVCPPKSDEEDEMLDEAYDVRENSRLSCQILLNDETNGILVEIPAQLD